MGSRIRYTLAYVFGIVALYYLIWFVKIRGTSPNAVLDSGNPSLIDKPLVPLEAHIMSKCPDAKVGFARSCC